MPADASIDHTEARNLAGSGPERDRSTDGRTPALMADGPGDPSSGRGGAERPGRPGEGIEGRYALRLGFPFVPVFPGFRVIVPSR
jgi:hypothetical protein